MLQEETYGLECDRKTELNLVYDVHKQEEDKLFAGIVALLPQAKP